MIPKIRLCLLLTILTLFPLAASAQNHASVWLSTPDRTALLQEQKPSLSFGHPTAGEPQILVNDQQSYQSIDGFGFALTGGSAQLMMRMSPARRKPLLQELFSTMGSSIGVSYLRVSIGASDMNDHVFSYDDLPSGQTDEGLARFSLDPDRADVIPVLKHILAINPRIKILASPWSAPAWMKTNGQVKGGSLRPEYYASYAAYLVKYIAGMKAEGIGIDAITIQNEPLNEKNTPSMQMLAPEEGTFIRDHLGPALQRAGIKTKVILYDHNCDVPEYPLSILRDANARKYVDGSGFHLYGGKIEVLSQVRQEFPDKNLYFTEQMVVDRQDGGAMNLANPVGRIVVGATRNWSRNVLLWNLAADPAFGPHTGDGGCPVCEGAITIDGDAITRNIAYYTVAHASKFVRPGSVRIETNELKTLPNVAFRTPAGRIVLIVANTSDTEQSFDILYKGKALVASLKPGAAGTYVW